MRLRKIEGEIAVRSNGNGYTARHRGKSATSTASKYGAMDRLMQKSYGRGTFYYRHVDTKWPHGEPLTELYNAVGSEEVA